MTQGRPLTDTLLRAWRGSLPQEEWSLLDQAALRAACTAQLEFGARRRRNQTLLRVVGTPETEEGRVPARAAAYSVIQLVTDDMPFLVDTLSMTLAQAQVSVQVIIHPILRVQRDALGRLRSLSQNLQANEGRNESWQYLRIDRVGDPVECQQLQRRLMTALADVRRA
jgi:glutamate dehydrogenase